MPEPEMYRSMYGPEITFAGVPRVELQDLGQGQYDVAFIGAPFDGGTTYRPGARFGPQAIRGTDYLPHDASRPHLALGVDPLQELRVADIGDVVMPSGDLMESIKRLEDAVHAVAAAGAIPVILGRRPHGRVPGRDRGGPARRLGPGVADPLRRARRHRRHPVGRRCTGTARRCGG